MKKGFTLIELLAVIAVLAIIMIIATPRIMDAIENSRIKAYIQDEQMMVKATETYLGNNVDKLPENIGDTTEITLGDLKTAEFINEISDCDGYVLVTKTAEGYSYNPQLKCGDSNSIANSIDDKLLLHYTFDDFQEPTENLFTGDGSFDSSYGEHIGDPALANSNFTRLYGNWKCATHYNDGVCRIEKGGLFGENKLVWDYNSVDGWKGVTLYNGMTLPANKTYTVSVYKRHRSGEDGNIGAYAFYGPEGYRYWFSWEKGASENLGEWVKGIATFTPDIDIYGTPYLYGHDKSTDLILEYDGYQIEAKPYATAFTKDVRTGRVTDYSINNRNINLELSNTPRWMEENGNGFYYFNGDDSLDSAVIKGGISYETKDEYTLSLWARRDNDGDFKVLLGDYVGNNLSMGLITQSGERVCFHTFDTMDKYMHSSANNSFPVDKWTQITITVKYTSHVDDLVSGMVEMYINGVKDGESTFSDIQVFDYRTLIIGSPNSNTMDRAFQGSIDDVKIYERYLSAQEIKYQYDTTKYKYE